MRLFVALYPDSGALDSLEHALTHVTGGAFNGTSGGPPLLRWTPREQWHVTLAFYGEVAPGAISELSAGLAQIAQERHVLDLHLRGAGVFDRRVLWVGLGGDTEDLRSLTAASAAVGTDAGLRTDDRPRQRAHVTVARLSAAGRATAWKSKRTRSRANGPGPDDALARALEGPAAALAVYEGPQWCATSLCLVESDRSGSRPVYRVVEQFALGDPAAPAGHTG